LIDHLIDHFAFSKSLSSPVKILVMSLPLKLIIDETRVSKKTGLCTIYIQYCATSTRRTNLDTEIAIPPLFWNKEACCIRRNLPQEFGQVSQLMDELERQIEVAKELVKYINKIKPELPTVFAKTTYTPGLNVATLPSAVEINKEIEKDNARNLDMYFQIDDYIQTQKKRVSDGMMNIYKNMKDHLKGFEAYRKTLPEYLDKPLTFECLDYNFYEGLVDYLTYVWVNQKCKTQNIIGLKKNTIGKTIKQFRTFLNNRARKKIIEPVDMAGWTILEEEVDAIYLNEKEIEDVYRLDLRAYPELIDYRDEIVLACLTGLRYSDFSTLEEVDVREDMLYKKQEKSNHWVVVPLRRVAQEILSRRFKCGFFPNTNQQFNRYGKTIFRMAGICKLIKHSYQKGKNSVIEVKPKWGWFSSHTCRRSFCTNEFLAGTPVALIMKISGHKSEKDFYKYIRITPEEAAIILIEIWAAREKEKEKETAALSKIHHVA
jgi:integrase